MRDGLYTRQGIYGISSAKVNDKKSVTWIASIPEGVWVTRDLSYGEIPTDLDSLESFLCMTMPEEYLK